MKYLFFAFILSQSIHAKDVTEYVCAIDKNMNIELSLMDAKNPSVSLLNKKSKFGLCFFETLPLGLIQNNKSANVEKVWKLELKKCDYYSEKLKTSLNFSKTASFKQSPGKSPSYFQLLKDQQPLFCTPKP